MKTINDPSKKTVDEQKLVVCDYAHTDGIVIGRSSHMIMFKFVWMDQSHTG